MQSNKKQQKEGIAACPAGKQGKAWPRETAERADRCLGSAGRSFSFCCYGEPHGLPAEIDGSVGAVEDTHVAHQLVDRRRAADSAAGTRWRVEDVVMSDACFQQGRREAMAKPMLAFFHSCVTRYSFAALISSGTIGKVFHAQGKESKARAGVKIFFNAEVDQQPGQGLNSLCHIEAARLQSATPTLSSSCTTRMRENCLLRAPGPRLRPPRRPLGQDR